jgi:glycosyltransferase involved in cell wall biosynthesis
VIVHLTSVHRRDDTRIFLKMCSSLASSGYEVVLVVADGLGNESSAGVKIVDAGGRVENRFFRMIKTSLSIYRAALKLDGSLYHFHDPELIPIGLLLKLRGKIIIFDSHEDYVSELLHKDYLPRIVGRVISIAYSRLERFATKRFDAIVAATTRIAEVIESYSNKNKVVVINNYPLVTDLPEKSQHSSKSIDAVFVGAISDVRGVYELVESLNYDQGIKLTIAGTFSTHKVENRITALPGWKLIDFRGQVSRAEVFELLAISRLGIVTYLPTPNHVASQPNKLFEYMSAGIPVVASNFPLWKHIIEGNNCGICVDPDSAKSIGAAVRRLIDNPKICAEMGANGMRAVIEKYNWEKEKIKLIELYEKLGLQTGGVV